MWPPSGTQTPSEQTHRWALQGATRADPCIQTSKQTKETKTETELVDGQDGEGGMTRMLTGQHWTSCCTRS
jgi:hypothetical protein